jgi:tetratricopeptide (TPR) repeat protein
MTKGPRCHGAARALAGSFSRAALVLLALGCLGGCGGAKGGGELAAPPATVADSRALQKLVQGVEAAETREKRDRALTLLREAVKVDPMLWEARFGLGVLLAGAGRLEEAEAELTKAQELASNAEDVVLALGEVRRRLGAPEKAAEVLQAFTGTFPEANDARVLLVACLRDAGRFDAAIEEAQAVLVRRAGDPSALSELALTYLEQGELDTAELLSAEALKVTPRPALAERTAGLVALARGDDALAFRHFEQASTIDPRDTTARLNIGTVLLRAGIYDRAEVAFRAVREVDPDDDSAQIGLAIALRGQGRRDHPGPYREAQKLLSELSEGRGGNLVATYNLAVLLADFLEEPDRATRLFDEYLRRAPKNHEGRAYAERRLKELKSAVAR